MKKENKKSEFSEKIKEMMERKDAIGIKKYLENLPINMKGEIFEKFIKVLYEGNGFLSNRKGGKNDGGADVLLYDPRNPRNVICIIQAKNHNRPLTVDEVTIELHKFDKKASKKYDCRHYKLISINGFVSDVEDLEKFHTMQKHLNISLYDWAYVEKLIFTYDSSNKSSPHVELHAHNKVTYENIVSQWENYNRVAAVQATGTGKSFLIAQCLSDFADKKKIVLAPSHYILDQIKNSFPWLETNTIFMTYKKLSLISDEEMHRLDVSLIVFDEFHRIGAVQWGGGVDKIVSTHPNAKILGTSATPIRYLDGERDMSNEFFKNNQASNIPLSDAIVQGILPTPKYVSSLYTLDEEIKKIKLKIESSENTQEEKTYLLNKLRQSVIDWEKTNNVENILKKHISTENKFIIFCENKNHLDDMEWVVESWFKKAKFGKRIRKYRVISGENDNNKEMNEFANGKEKDTIYLLFSIDMLNEGLHIKGVDGVILLRPTQSPIVFYQQIGRAIDAGKTKNPLILDLVNNFSSVRSNDFRNDLVGSEIKLNHIRSEFGLSDIKSDFELFVSDETHDAQNLFAQLESKLLNFWDARYQELIHYKSIHGNCLVPFNDKENEVLANWTGTQRRDLKRKRLSQDKINKLNEIGFVWDVLDAKWENMFSLLCEYKSLHGDCFVPNLYEPNKQLGSWVSVQRGLYKEGSLSQNKINKLNEIGFVWDVLDAQWEEMFSILCEYKSINGNCVVVSNNKSNKTLERWVIKQRNSFKKALLSQNKINKLNEIGFVWDVLDTQWEGMFSLLCEYKKLNGDLYISRIYRVNKELYYWVKGQRERFRKKSLSQYRIDKLNEIEFIWSELDSKWEEMFFLLCKYKDSHGDCLVKFNDKTYKELANWVTNQRENFKKENLPKDKIDRLSEIGFVWNGFDAKWEEMFSLLSKYKNSHNNYSIPSFDESNKGLRNWINKQRQYFKAGTLSQARIDKMNKIGFSWDYTEIKWEEMYALLCEYKSFYGNCLVPNKYEINQKLGTWVSKQRYLFKKDSLSKYKVDKLNELGFVWSVK